MSLNWNMHYGVFPNVTAYQGPRGMVLVRQPLFAVCIPIGEKMRFAIAVKQPHNASVDRSQVSTPGGT